MARGAPRICTTRTGSANAASKVVTSTEDGSEGDRGFITVPLARAFAERSRRSGRVALRVRADADDARGRRTSRSKHGEDVEVSLEQTMGCGLGGCYSCVVPHPRRRAARRISCARASRVPCFPAARSSGRSWPIDDQDVNPSTPTAAARLGTIEPLDLTVRIGSLTLKNPLIAASGCFGYGVEYADVVDLSSLGAVCVKGLFLTEREGHRAASASSKRPPA